MISTTYGHPETLCMELHAPSPQLFFIPRPQLRVP